MTSCVYECLRNRNQISLLILNKAKYGKEKFASIRLMLEVNFGDNFLFMFNYVLLGAFKNCKEVT